MTTASALATVYFICGAIIFLLAATILRYSARTAVGWATALVLLFASFGPMLGAASIILERNLREGTLLFGSLVASFDYTWEFFFPSLVLFALVHPVRNRIWPYIKRGAFLLYVPHVFHLIMLIFLLDRVNPSKTFDFLVDLPFADGGLAPTIGTISSSLNVLMELLFKAHRTLFSFVNISYALFSMILLGASMRRDLAPRVRRQTRAVIIGLGACIATYALARIMPVVYSHAAGQQVMTLFVNASLILGGGSIAYAIVRYEFLDLRQIARKGIFYGAAVAVFASLYLVIVKQFMTFLDRFSGSRMEFVETGLIVVFIILFQPVFSRLEEWAERRVLSEEKTPRFRIRRLSAELLSMIDLDDMREKTRQALEAIFGAEEVELLLSREIDDEPDDAYAGRVLETLAQFREPIVRLDFLEALGFLNVTGRMFMRPGRKLIDEAVEMLPGTVRRFARYELIVPVMRGQKCEAVLLLGHRREHRGYSSEEQALISMLSAQISASLARIDLLAQVVEKKLIEEELNIARTIQLNLLPSGPPAVERYDAAAVSFSSKQVGGDYYDFLQRDGMLACTVADVSGKGVPASLLMASLQASLRSMVEHMHDPVGLVGRLNDVMCDITAPDKFATLFYSCLDTKKNEIVYTNAGHFFPVVIRDGGRIEILDYSGLILGVQPGFVYENRRTSLSPGDVLVVTTDGVTEAESTDGDLFGEERLHPLLAGLRDRDAAGIMDEIIETVNRFAWPNGANDDLTILVLKRTE